MRDTSARMLALLGLLQSRADWSGATGRCEPGGMTASSALHHNTYFDGKVHRLSDYRGKSVVLWFYPKADTPG